MEALMYTYKEFLSGKFDDNKNALDVDPLKLETFKAYLEEHGPEKAQSFFDGIVFMSKHIDNAAFRYDKKYGVWRDNSSTTLGTQMNEIKHETDDFIKDVKKAKLIKKNKL
jgi:hypothetical protein